MGMRADWLSALAAFVLPWLASRIGRRGVHALCLALGGVALIGMNLISDPRWLLINMVGIGFAWASILCMPYAILAGALPARRMGFYMGVFNFFIVLPQVLAAGILGYITREYFDGNAMSALALGGASMLLAALMTLKVKDVDEAVSEHNGSGAIAPVTA